MGLIFGRAAPTLRVSNMATALCLWQEVLGFDVTFRNGDPVSFAIVKSGDAEVHMTLSRGHHGHDENVVHLLVNDAEALCTKLGKAGVTIVAAQRSVTPTMTGFVFADADGNRIDVGQSLL